MPEKHRSKTNMVLGAFKDTEEIQAQRPETVLKPANKNMKKKNQTETEQFAVEADLSVNAEEEIAERAYELWRQRNCEHGNDWADWFQAEREINQ
jgi:hypothetical protein